MKMLKHTIKGCLVKYNTPWHDGTIVTQETFKNNAKKIVPINTDFRTMNEPASVVGYAQLLIGEDGVYYSGRLIDSEVSEKMIQKVIKEKYRLGLYANHIRFKKGTRELIEGNICAMAFTPFIDNAAEVIEIAVENS
jgi:hypothetical protein